MSRRQKRRIGWGAVLLAGVLLVGLGYQFAASQLLIPATGGATGAGGQTGPSGPSGPAGPASLPASTLACASPLPSDPSAPLTGWLLYCVDAGGGKTAMRVLFPTGSPQQIAVEP